jgi:hypothetical protein
MEIFLLLALLVIPNSHSVMYRPKNELAKVRNELLELLKPGHQDDQNEIKRPDQRSQLPGPPEPENPELPNGSRGFEMAYEKETTV